jgi:hypothetical protein
MGKEENHSQVEEVRRSSSPGPSADEQVWDWQQTEVEDDGSYMFHFLPISTAAASLPPPSFLSHHYTHTPS